MLAIVYAKLFWSDSKRDCVSVTVYEHKSLYSAWCVYLAPKAGIFSLQRVLNELCKVSAKA